MHCRCRTLKPSLGAHLTARRASVREIAEQPSLIIAGTHGPGTGVVARFLGGLGIDLDGLERAATAALHAQIFEQACPAGEPGVRDWGWTESERLDEAAVEAARDRAELLVAARRDGATVPWGFAEPRATRLLSLWSRVLPGAAFVLVYDAPWDSVAGALHGGPPELATRPDYAARAWLGYARSVQAFARAQRARCVVVHAGATRRR